MKDTSASAVTSDQIALAIVSAARVHGDDPLAIPGGEGSTRTRVLAYAALTEAFPGLVKAKAARWCGFVSQANASAHLHHARKAKWWSETALDEIVGELVADEVEGEEHPSPSSAGGEAPHFDVTERRLIVRMRERGADATAIAAALGADANEVSAWLLQYRGQG